MQPPTVWAIPEVVGDIFPVCHLGDVKTHLELAPGRHYAVSTLGNDSIPMVISRVKSEIHPIPDEAIFEFVYREIADKVSELQTNSDCQPTSSGSIKQTRFTTEVPNVIEVRLEVTDIWESLEGVESLPFELSGTCQYNLSDSALTDLKPDVVRLTTTGPDGSPRSVKGSQVSAVGISISTGPPPVKAKQGVTQETTLLRRA